MEPELRRLAVERAYREHVDDVYRVAFAILRDPDAASDATHDAFARAFERWEQYDANRPLRPWLQGIVAHAALDALRRRRSRPVLIPLLRDAGAAGEGEGRSLDRSADLGPDPAAILSQREAIDQGLASLPPQSRAAVVLRHAYGYDYAEIASFLRTTPGNVGSILTRAHASLRARLSAEPGASVPDAGRSRPASR